MGDTGLGHRRVGRRSDPAGFRTIIANGQGANTALPIYGFYMNAAYADESLGLSQADFMRPEAWAWIRWIVGN